MYSCFSQCHWSEIPGYNVFNLQWILVIYTAQLTFSILSGIYTVSSVVRIVRSQILCLISFCKGSWEYFFFFFPLQKYRQHRRIFLTIAICKTVDIPSISLDVFGEEPTIYRVLLHCWLIITQWLINSKFFFMS